MNSLYVLNNLIAQGNAGEPVANTNSFWDPAIIIPSAAVLLSAVSTILVTGYNERKRHRLTAHLERKQAHYSELFEFIAKSIRIIKTSNTHNYPKNLRVQELTKVLDDLDGERIYALTNIWASEAVQKSAYQWLDLIREYTAYLKKILEQHTTGMSDEEMETTNAELKNLNGRLGNQADVIRKNILDDLEINQVKRKRFGK